MATATITNLTLRPLELTGGRLLQPDGRIDDWEIGDRERALADGGALDIVSAKRGRGGHDGEEK